MQTHFESKLMQLEEEWLNFTKGEIEPEIEGKIRSNIANICLRAYRNMNARIKDDSLFDSYNELLMKMSYDWARDMVQEHIHQKDNWKKKLIQLSAVDYIHALHNSRRSRS